MDNLIGKDILLWRDRYDEALKLQGIPCTYQFPNLPDSDTQGQTLVDSYSDYINTHIFFDGSPTVKTYKRYGWVVENSEDLPFLIHCSFNLPHLQKDCIFRFAGQYTDLPDRIFRVTELTYALQAADHIICQVVPVYDEKHVTGKTPSEVKHTFNKSNHFIKPNTDYRGDYYDTPRKFRGD